MAGLRQIVSGPTFTPLPYGLLSVVQPVDPPEDHWQNGITYTTRCGGGGTTYEECIVITGTGVPGGAGAPPAQPTKVANLTQGVRAATPFTCVAEFDCAPVGFEDVDTAASDALARVESWYIERAFWTGLAGPTGAQQRVVFPSLTNGAGFPITSTLVDSQGVTLQAPIVTGGGPFKPARALGVLEGLLADCYKGVGVIHMAQSLLPVFMGASMTTVIRQQAQLRTMNGNIVSVGAGYAGTGPDGSAPVAGQAWLYGTGAVAMRRSGVRVMSARESFDRAKNTQKMIAERTYVLNWDCCHFAVLVDLT